MNLSIITVFSEIHETFLQTSLIGRAIKDSRINCNIIQLSSLCAIKERIDEPTAGPGVGMIIKPSVIERAINHCEQQWGKGFKVFFSPQGSVLTQNTLKKIYTNLTYQAPTNEHSKTNTPHLILVCSRYEGIDQRIEDTYADAVISIGDYVLMGGDLPAQVFLEGLLRLLPGIIGNQESVEHESFSGPFLDYPAYAQTQDWQGNQVPEILKSGHHAAIQAWRLDEACKKTVLKRFDWLRSQPLSPDAKTLITKHIPNHYAVLMHAEVMLKNNEVGTSSIASLDLHDIARSSATYGLKKYFVVTKLKDQMELMTTFLGFWQSTEGKNYNQTRYDAVKRVTPATSLDEVIATITELEGKQPLLIATSARSVDTAHQIDYTNQGEVWQHNRPVLFIFGTAHGLSPAVINRCDYLLLPIKGLSSYNHLSVRSAAAIIFDRWLGLTEKINHSDCQEGLSLKKEE